MIDWIKGLLGLEHNPTGRYYVYQLIDPRFRFPRIFYLGKGTGDEMTRHDRDMRMLLKKGRGGAMKLGCKHKRILEIIDDGYEVGHEIIFHTDSEEEAYRVEAYYIEKIGLEKLANEQYGHKPKKRRRAA